MLPSGCGKGVLSSLFVRAESGVIGRISGIPVEQLHRKVRIFKPARTAMQQGARKTETWKMEWKGAEKWANPLMGWTSTSDPLSQTRLFFETAEEAAAFADKNGWKYEIEQPHVAEVKEKSYGNNFKFEPVRDLDDV